MYLTKEPLYKNVKAKFVLIKDSKALSGMKVFKTVMNIFCKEQSNVCALCYDGHSEELLHGLNQYKIDIIDGFSDPFHWKNPDAPATLFSIDAIAERFSNFQGVLCIYSFTSLIISNGLYRVYKALHKLLRFNSYLHIVAILHCDVHDSMDNQVIEKLASTVLDVQVDNDEKQLLSTVHYSSGKVSNKLVEYNVSDSFEFSVLSDVKSRNKSLPAKQPDPTANLTFNLRLNDQEKEARSQLQLPYMKMQTSDASVIQNLLDDDCYDEEDPDDDLDI